MGDRTYSAMDVVRLAGVTYRQLDYWCRTGYVTPAREGTGSGGPVRKFSADDLDRIRLTRKLLDAGVAWWVIRRHRDPLKTADRVCAAIMHLVEGAR